MHILIQTGNKIPIYEQIVNSMKESIIRKELQPREMLPSIRALALDLGISVITTKHAYEELEKEGLIYSIQGKGFYVNEPDLDKLREQQFCQLEEELVNWMEKGKKLGLTLRDMQDLLNTLYERSEAR